MASGVKDTGCFLASYRLNTLLGMRFRMYHFVLSSTCIHIVEMSQDVLHFLFSTDMLQPTATEDSMGFSCLFSEKLAVLAKSY